MKENMSSLWLNDCYSIKVIVFVAIDNDMVGLVKRPHCPSRFFNVDNGQARERRGGDFVSG